MGKPLKKGTCLSILPYACPEPVLAKHCHSFTFKQNSNTKNGTELCPQWTSSLEIPLVFNFHATWETNPYHIWMICHAADFEICQKFQHLNSVDSAKTSSGQTLGKRRSTEACAPVLADTHVAQQPSRRRAGVRLETKNSLQVANFLTTKRPHLPRQARDKKIDGKLNDSDRVFLRSGPSTSRLRYPPCKITQFLLRFLLPHACKRGSIDSTYSDNSEASDGD